MKRKILFLIGLVVLISQVNSQSLMQEFNKLLSKNDTIGQLELLQKWETSTTSDPDLYVAYFNYYLKKSMKEVVRFGKTPKSKTSIQILDTLTKEPIGYMNSEIFYKPDEINHGVQYINKGIEKFPARLDMRFGKVYVFGITGDYDGFTKEIIDAIDYSQVIDNKWIWKENKPLENPKNFLLGNIQSYQNQLYKTGDDFLLNNMERIAKEVIKYYPDNVESLSNLSVVYLIKKNYEEAIEALLKAEKIAPKDLIVLSNTAQAYKLKGDKENAIKYYELMDKYGDEKAKQYAKKQIQELGTK